MDGKDVLKGKTFLGVVNKLLNTKRLLTKPSIVLLSRLKQTFPPIIGILFIIEICLKSFFDKNFQNQLL